jgi:ribose 5-phosphate isomerase B
MRVVFGADHAGFSLKEILLEHVAALGHEVVDVGTNSTAPVDYPVFSRALAEAIINGDAERGVLVCGSGVGASVAANKVTGIRAAICHDCYSAAQGVEHDNMNVLTLGGRVIGIESAKVLVEAFLGATFHSDVERYVRRVGEIEAIERDYSHG